jgi:hypothetical protein
VTETFYDRKRPAQHTRAFGAATVRCADQQRELKSIQTVRSLDAYPGLMAGFQKTSTGFEE